MFLLIGISNLSAVGVQMEKREKSILKTMDEPNIGQQITYFPDSDITLHYSDDGLTPSFNFKLSAYDLNIGWPQGEPDSYVTIRGRIDFGDGESTGWSEYKKAGTQTPLKVEESHTYANSERSYTVTFKTEDQAGESTTASINILVQKSKSKTAYNSAIQNLLVKLSVQFPLLQHLLKF